MKNNKGRADIPGTKIHLNQEEYQLQMDLPKYFNVEYYYQNSNSRTRTSMKGSVSQHLYGATTENSVLDYLKKKHLQHEIYLIRITWK